MNQAAEIWNEFVAKKRQYEKGEYNKVYTRPPTGKNLTFCLRIQEDLEKYGVSISKWIEAQFYVFKIKFERTPYLNQIYGEKAYQRYLEYVAQGWDRNFVTVGSKVITPKSKSKEVLYGEELLKKVAPLHPELSEIDLVKLFADQFPIEFLQHYFHSKQDLEDEVSRKLRLIEERLSR